MNLQDMQDVQDMRYAKKCSTFYAKCDKTCVRFINKTDQKLFIIIRITLLMT